MVLQTAPAYISAAGYQHPAELDRNILKGLFQRSGRIRYGDLVVTPTLVAQQYSIASGGAFLLGAESNQQGGYFAWSNTAELGSVNAPSASPRIDTLLLRVIDSQYGSISGQPRAAWDLVAGTPAGSPTAHPDSDFNSGGPNYIPGAWWRVADIRVNPGDGVIPSNQITNNQRYVRVPGGTVICTSTTRPSDPVAGDKIYETDTKLQYLHDGSGWVLESQFRRIDCKEQSADIGATTAEVYHSSLSITATLIQGHRYRGIFDGVCRASAVAAADAANLRLRYKPGNSVDSAGTLFDIGNTRAIHFHNVNYLQNCTIVGEFVAPTTATYTMGVGWYRPSGSGSATVTLDYANGNRNTFSIHHVAAS